MAGACVFKTVCKSLNASDVDESGVSSDILGDDVSVSCD